MTFPKQMANIDSETSREREVRDSEGLVYYRGFLERSPLFLLSLQKLVCYDYSGETDIKS